MKNLILSVVFLLTLSSGIVPAQEKYVSLSSGPVTVFRQGAQVTGEASVALQPGETEVVAGGLPSYLDENSIIVRGEGDFMITGVSFRNNYMAPPAESEAIEALRAKISALQAKIEDETVQLESLNEREIMLKENYDVVSNKTTLTAEQLKSFMDLFSTDVAATKSAILKRKRTIEEYSKEKARLESQLAGSTDRSKQPSGEIVVSITSTKAGNGNLWFSYVTYNAGWSPSYDIRVDDIDSPARVIYRADIWQNSGLDWKDVKISLSNSTPITSGTLPVPGIWFLDFYQPEMLNEVVVAYGTKSAKSMPARAVAEDREMMVAEEAAPMPVTVSESNISFSFDISVPQTIPTGGKPKKVELQRYDVPATYSYAATPKLSPSAFLMGYITDWEKYNFLPGASNIYFNNTFTGRGYINAGSVSDTLPVSLGADNGINVKRERRTDFTSSKMIGSNRQETLSFLITVRNNKSRPVKIKLRDQLPVPQNSEITVEAAELSGGVVDQATGMVTWDLQVEPRQAREIIFTYTVRYPKSKRVILE